MIQNIFLLRLHSQLNTGMGCELLQRRARIALSWSTQSATMKVQRTVCTSMFSPQW